MNKIKSKITTGKPAVLGVTNNLLTDLRVLEVVQSLAKQLTQEYGRGYSRPALFRMVKFAEIFPDVEIVSTLSRQLSWSHFMELIYLKDDLRRQFYAEICTIERWSVHTLRDKINRMLFERTAIAKKPEDIAEQVAKKHPSGLFFAQVNPDQNKSNYLALIQVTFESQNLSQKNCQKKY